MMAYNFSAPRPRPAYLNQQPMGGQVAQPTYAQRPKTMGAGNYDPATGLSANSGAPMFQGAGQMPQQHPYALGASSPSMGMGQQQPISYAQRPKTLGAGNYDPTTRLSANSGTPMFQGAGQMPQQSIGGMAPSGQPQGLLGGRDRFVQQSYHKPWDQLTGQQQRWINLKYPGQG